MALALIGCDQATRSEGPSDQTSEVSDIEFPEAPVVYTFNKADQYSMPGNVAWAYAFDNENPTFNMAVYCGTNEGHCLNAPLNSGKVVLETMNGLVTAAEAEVELSIQYSGWANKYASYEKEFMWQSFFSTRLLYSTKDANGQLKEHAEEFVLRMNDLGSPTVVPWKSNEKSIRYGNGNVQDIYRVKARLPAEAENIRVQIYDVGASILQIQKLDIKVTLL